MPRPPVAFRRSDFPGYRKLVQRCSYCPLPTQSQPFPRADARSGRSNTDPLETCRRLPSQRYKYRWSLIYDLFPIANINLKQLRPGTGQC